MPCRAFLNGGLHGRLPTHVRRRYRRNVCDGSRAPGSGPGLRGDSDKGFPTHFLLRQGATSTMTTMLPRAGRADIRAKTLRKDRWWFEPTYTVVGLSAWLIYGFVHVLMQKWYFA